MIWWLWLLAGPPGLGLLAGLYRGSGEIWPPLLMGASLSIICALFELLRRVLAPESGRRLLGGTLLGGAAWALLLALLKPFSGLTWMLIAPFHQAGIYLICVCLATVLLPAGLPDWPQRAARSSKGLLWLLVICGLALLAGLAVGLKAMTLGQSGMEAGGLKGIIKNPALLLAGLGLAGALLTALAAWKPLWLLRLAAALGFGLLWAGFGLDVVSAMAPLVERVGGEVMQLGFLAAACGLGLRLASLNTPRSGSGKP